MRHNLDYDRPSRLARGVIVLSTVGISMIAAWVFAPILLEKYAAYTGSDTAAPSSREPADDPVTASAAVVMPSAIAAPAPSAAAGTTAVASPAEDNAPTRAVRPQTGSTGTRPAVPWPIASSPPAPAAADNPTVQYAAVDPGIEAESAENVPLPRSRPSRLIATHLAIPLPRPRPDIESELAGPPTTFDLQVERMR